MKMFGLVFLLILGLFFVNHEISAQIVTTGSPLKESNFSSQPAVQNFITFYQHGGRITMELGLANSGLHKKMIQRIFREAGVPENLAAISQTLWMGAAEADGLWLFVDKTAQKYGLKTTEFLDERLSFEKATRATAQSLKYLSKKYKGNWELALAAYHSGEQKVDDAIKRASSKSFGKISKYLPDETRNFGPNVLATVLMAGNPKKYGFEDIQPDSPIEYESVRISPSLSLELMAQFSDSSLENIKSLNPELISTTTPPEPYVIRVPIGKGKILAQKVKSLPSK